MRGESDLLSRAIYYKHKENRIRCIVLDSHRSSGLRLSCLTGKKNMGFSDLARHNFAKITNAGIDLLLRGYHDIHRTEWF